MTEEEWLKCDDWTRLLSFLQAHVGRRKLLLSNCAVCWALAPVIRHKQSFHALRVLEDYVDGVASEKELAVAHNWARSSLGQCPADWHGSYFARCAVCNLTITPEAVLGYPHGNESGNYHSALREPNLSRVPVDDLRARGVLGLRCVNGPLPFRPVAFSTAWRTSDVMLLATGIYAERAFDRMPILADALQEADCDSDDILDHLRDPNAQHARGCWALDLVLGKE